MIFVTGDTHSDFRRFSTDRFPDQRYMTKNDYVVICGDFGGVWRDSPEERYWLDWLNDKSFTTLFVDGNHENFGRLRSDEFEHADFFGGRVDKIRDSIFHLNRGEIYQLQGLSFFAFGGASSHDIRDGIVDPNDFQRTVDMARTVARMRSEGKQFRVKGLSWWPEEMPSQDEMGNAIRNLEKCSYKVDYVITHCLPQEVASVFSQGLYKSDPLTLFFNRILHDGLWFKNWYCGHYHIDSVVMGKFEILYEKIVRIL